ncbi:MAG: hypothetical protein WA667_00005, partial [Candidatus Nitrosopolaris sp.]
MSAYAQQYGGFGLDTLNPCPVSTIYDDGLLIQNNIRPTDTGLFKQCDRLSQGSLRFRFRYYSVNTLIVY